MIVGITFCEIIPFVLEYSWGLNQKNVVFFGIEQSIHFISKEHIIIMFTHYQLIDKLNR